MLVGYDAVQFGRCVSAYPKKPAVSIIRVAYSKEISL
jgi:hypothetical protein